MMVLIRFLSMFLKEEIGEMVDRVDTDGSGTIEFMEFLILMGKILQVRLKNIIQPSIY